MAIDSDVTFDYVNKIAKRHSGASSTVYSVNAFYSYMSDVFDEIVQLSMRVAISAQTPTSYTIINGWYIQEELSKYLTVGAIQTVGYLDEIRTLHCGASGWINFITSDVGLPLVGVTTADSGIILDYDNTNHKIWIRMDDTGDLFDNATENYTCTGTGRGTATAISTTGEMVFANPYTLGTLEGTPQLYIYQDGDKISGWWTTGHFDILIKVTESGVNIDNRKITVFGRHWTDEYTAFGITLTTAGQNAIPLGTKDDLNNHSTEADVEDYTDGTIATIAIDYQFGSPYSYDIGDGDGVQDYECRIDCDGQPLSIVYEVMKWWTRTDSTKQLETGTDAAFVNGEAYRYVDDTYAEVVTSPLGTFAGGQFFGARSIYPINLHGNDAQAFQLIDKAGVTRDPPNYQSFQVTACVSGDRVAVFAESGGDVNKAQYTLRAGVNNNNELEIIGAIPVDTPTTGHIIIVDDDGSEIAYAYTVWVGSIFTVIIGAGQYSGGQNCYVPYIYEQVSGTSASEAVIYVADRDVITRLRLKGILPFETTGVFGTSGYAVAAIRTVDNVVT